MRRLVPWRGMSNKALVTPSHQQRLASASVLANVSIWTSRFVQLRPYYQVLVNQLLESTFFLRIIDNNKRSFPLKATAIVDISDAFVLYAVTSRYLSSCVYPVCGAQGLIELVDNANEETEREGESVFVSTVISYNVFAQNPPTENSVAGAFNQVFAELSVDWHCANDYSTELFGEEPFKPTPDDWYLFSKVVRFAYDYQLLEVFIQKSELKDKIHLTQSPLLYDRYQLCLWMKKDDLALAQHYFQLSVE